LSKNGKLKMPNRNRGAQTLKGFENKSFETNI
jgi:hypothetical protein